MFELLFRFGHVGGILGLFHPLLQIIEVVHQLLLFFLETFELILQFFLLLRGLGFLELVLQFLHFLGQRFLTAGKFLEPVHHLQILLLLGGLLLRGLLLLLIALFFLLEFQVHELVLHLLLFSAGAL